MTSLVTGATVVAGVVGAPVTRSLSPVLHNAWIAKAGLDAIYVAFAPTVATFMSFAEGMRGGAIRGVNVTAPFKEQALAVASAATPRATAAGAANLLIFEPTGEISADNTDGCGLLSAFAEQAPSFAASQGPVVLLGAGGAARGAAAALLEAGAPEVRIVNRSPERGRALTRLLGERSTYFEWGDMAAAFADAAAIINATPAGWSGAENVEAPLQHAPPGAVVMDMTYRPLRTAFLRSAESSGRTTVDGLAMLIGQAAPSFRSLFGMEPPPIDVRRLALKSLEAEG
jgi:shikimate dehydrogenase